MVVNIRPSAKMPKRDPMTFDYGRAQNLTGRLARQGSDFRSQIVRIDSGNLQGRAGVGLFFSPFCR